MAAVVFSDVKSLPTSVLVDSKQQSDAAIGANNKGNHFIYQMADGFLESVELIDRIENQFDCIWRNSREQKLQKKQFPFIFANCFI